MAEWHTIVACHDPGKLDVSKICEQCDENSPSDRTENPTLETGTHSVLIVAWCKKCGVLAPVLETVSFRVRMHVSQTVTLDCWHAIVIRD